MSRHSCHSQESTDQGGSRMWHKASLWEHFNCTPTPLTFRHSLRLRGPSRGDCRPSLPMRGCKWRPGTSEGHDTLKPLPHTPSCCLKRNLHRDLSPRRVPTPLSPSIPQKEMLTHHIVPPRSKGSTEALHVSSPVPGVPAAGLCLL